MLDLVSIPKTPIVGKNLVGESWLEAESTIEVRTPYTGEVLGHVPDSGSDVVDAAARAAQAAFADWRQVPIKERSQPLFKFRQLVLDEIESLANLAALEAGKTVDEARAGVLKGIEVVDFALSMQNLDRGGALQVSRGVSCETRREPLGVVAGITPFNFPAMVPMWLFPIAITAGNTFILKPSEKVPLSALRLGELVQKAGYPAGVLQIVNGTHQAASAIIDHPEVRGVAFVGSTAVAKQVYSRAASLGKRALALGGAKNHLIVVPDADPGITVDGVVSSFTGCAGQRCMAASLMIAVGEVEPFITEIADRSGRFELGRDMGALIDEAAYKRLVAALDRAVADGATLRVDGRQGLAPRGYEGGYWLAPSILDHVKPEWDCATAELFGPVLTIVRVDTLEEALALGKAGVYGNATSVFTRNGAIARYVAEHSEAGMIGVNIGVPVPREPFSFGGTKASRFGHGDITGQGGLDFWTHLKKITSKWALQVDHNWMS